MDLIPNKEGEALAIKLMAARAVAAYAEGTALSNKMQELLRNLIIENMREDVTDEQMDNYLYEECAKRKLDPEEVMVHFTAIGESVNELLA